MARGITGAVLVPSCGAVYTANSLRGGTIDGPNERPGEGSTIAENFHHVTDTPFTAIITNTKPEGLEEGEYEFFYTKDPGSIFDALGTATYNTGKGAITGATMVVCCPIKEAMRGHDKVDDKGEKGGFVGAISGFGAGLTTGAVGGLATAGAGLTYSAGQIGYGFTSPSNLTETSKKVHDIGTIVKTSAKVRFTFLSLLPSFSLSLSLSPSSSSLSSFSCPSSSSTHILSGRFLTCSSLFSLSTLFSLPLSLFLPPSLCRSPCGEWWASRTREASLASPRLPPRPSPNYVDGSGRSDWGRRDSASATSTLAWGASSIVFVRSGLESWE